MTDKEKSGQNPDDANPEGKPADKEVLPNTDEQKPEGTVPTGKAGEEDPEDESKKTFDYNYVKTLREEAKNNRIKASDLQKEKTDLEKKVQTYEREKMTEDEKLKADLSKYETELIPQKDKQIQSLQVSVQASKLGIVDPEVAEKLIDWDKVDATDPAAVEKALSSLIESKPWLKKDAEGAKKPPKVTTSTSTANPASTSNATKKFTRADLKSMTPEEINEAYSNGGLKEALAEGSVAEE